MTHSTCAGRRVCAPKNLGWVSAAVGAAFLALYGATLCRGVYPGASAAWISQAEGFSPWMSGTHPLWRLCVGLWQRIPGCGGGGGLNALSALCGAVAAALFCRYAARWVYSAIRVEREAALNPAETSAAGGATEDDAREERLVSRVAVASGVFAAALFGTGLAVWSASTRFQPEAFDLAWVWAALALYQSYTLRRGLWRLYALVLLCGLGAVETTMFWVAAPFLLGAVTAFLYKHHRLRFGLCAGLLLTGLLGLGVYGISAYGFAQSAAGSGWREAFRQMAALQLREVALYLPARGWPFVVALLVVPWLVFQMGYWSRLHLRRDFRSDTLMGVALVATVLLQFGVPLPPWTQWRLIGRLPVLESSLAAMLGGWAFAYWAYGAVFRWEPAKLVAGKEARRFETLVRYKRWLSMGLCSLLLALSVAAACRSGWLADGRRGAFADRCAQEILGQLGGRTWLVSDGSLDPHLKALAAAQGRTLRVLSLAAECDPGLVRQIRRWVSEEPRMQANRDRLLNAADLGAGAFVREWLAVDPEAENALALYCVPDLWTAAGLVPRPDRFLFFARRSADGLESRPLLEEQRVFWARMRPLLPPVEDVREPSDRLRRSRRGHLSLVANDLGVLLMDLGRGEEAFDAFGDSLLWDPRNLSALANRALLVGKGVRPAEKDSAEAAFKKAVAFFKRQPRAFDVVRLYGQLRTPAAVFGVGAVWAQGGQYGLAQGGLLRAAALEEEGDRRDAILACLGGMNVEAGETGQGEEIFRNLLKKDPRNLVALMGMLNLSLRNGDADAAGKWLAQARDAGANETSVAFAEAQLDVVRRDFESARGRLLRLTDTAPKNLDAWALLAASLIQLGRLDDVANQVLPKMEAVVNKQPNSRVYQVRGDLARARGPAAYGEARDMYRRALKLSPGRLGLLETLVDLDLRLDDQAAAGRDASDLLRADPCNANGHFVLGNQAVVRGELDAAESHLRASVARTGTPQALNNLAEVLLRKGALEAAEDAARQALSKADGNASVLDTLASVLFKRGKTDEALKTIARARTIAPENWSLALTQARVFMAADRKEEARVLLKEVENHADALPQYLRDEMARVAQEWRTRR